MGLSVFIVFDHAAYGDYGRLQTLASVGLSIFIVFDCVPYGRLQALASVELSAFYCF